MLVSVDGPPRRFTLTMVVQRDVGGGFTAYVPELPGCESFGDSMEELRANVREAAEMWLEGAEDFVEGLPDFVGVETLEMEI